MVNIPLKVNGEVFFAPEIFKLMSEDQVGGTIASSITETQIAEATFTASQGSEGFLVTATGKVKNNSGTLNTGTIKLYTGTNVAFGSNTVRKTITRDKHNNAQSDETGWAMTLFVTADPTLALRFQITGQNSDNNANAVITCESLTVVGV